MTKKIFCIMLALMMVATMFLTGCKDTDEDKPNSSTPVESLDSSEDVSEEVSTPDSSATVSGDESNDSSEDISDETSDISDESSEDNSEDISDESGDISQEIDSSEPDSSVADEPDDSSAPEVPDDSSAPVVEPDESEVPDDSSAVVCNHNYISTTTPATCLSAGKTEEKCSLCGDVKSSKTIAALGHDYKVTQNGNTTVKTCQRCGDTKTETTTGSCNGNHSYEKVRTVPATCQAVGYTEYKCSKCGAVDKRDVTAQLFHDYQFTKTVAPTATTEGYDLYTCTLCGHGDKRFVKPATGETNTGYSCGVEGHVCESAEVHEVVMMKTEEGCLYCGSHSCPVFFENPNGWADYTHCPEYDVTKDYSYYCQNCHLPRGDGPGYCGHHMLGYDYTCEWCNTFVPGGSCHHCTVTPPEAELVTFTFNANGGSLNGFPETIVAEKGEYINVDAGTSYCAYPMPTRDGYEFGGWVTNPNETDPWKAEYTFSSDDGLTWYVFWYKNS